jgi:hypothetical protein
MGIRNENKSDIKRNEKKIQIQIKADKRTCNKLMFESVCVCSLCG